MKFGKNEFYTQADNKEIEKIPIALSMPYCKMFSFFELYHFTSFSTFVLSLRVGK